MGDFSGTPEEIDRDLRALCERDGICKILSDVSAMCITCGAAITLLHRQRFIEKLCWALTLSTDSISFGEETDARVEQFIDDFGRGLYGNPTPGDPFGDKATTFEAMELP